MEDNFDVDQFLTITFDIMEKVAKDLAPIKKELNEKYPESSYERLMEYQQAFRNIISKYQSEIYDKYNISLSEYNEG